MRVVAAYDLINADWFSLSDPYAKAEWETTATNYDAERGREQLGWVSFS